MYNTMHRPLRGLASVAIAASALVGLSTSASAASLEAVASLSRTNGDVAAGFTAGLSLDGITSHTAPKAYYIRFTGMTPVGSRNNLSCKNINGVVSGSV